MKPLSPRVLLAATALCAGFAASATEQAIELDTPTGPIKGTLTLPAGAAAAPVALIIAGSGPTDRDGNAPAPAGKNDSLKLLALALEKAGVASVRYDKRGIAASSQAGAAESNLRIESYVADAAAWVDKLTDDPRFTGVAVIGHSEGSLIGMLAVQRSRAAAFVSIAGPGRPAAAVLRRQLAGRMPPELAERNEAILSALEAGRTTADVPASLASLYRVEVQPYLISWFKYSPTEELAKLTVPCRLVQGATDIQVGVADAEALQAARPSCGLAVIPGMNHVMKMVANDRARQIASYGDPTLPLAPGFSETLTEFFGSPAVRSAMQGVHEAPGGASGAKP